MAKKKKKKRRLQATKKRARRFKHAKDVKEKAFQRFMESYKKALETKMKKQDEEE